MRKDAGVIKIRSAVAVPLLRKRLVQCPEHGSVFDVTTGECVMPSQDGWSGPMRTYATRVEGDVVQVSLR